MEEEEIAVEIITTTIIEGTKISKYVRIKCLSNNHKKIYLDESMSQCFREL